ncbi:MAG: transcription antitermination factor NusB [Desulfamplus sp.]|nr:transcription antitermination factor NusB [Desulfamplus sp.]MBF0390882.1 transcription antitermination factor NusB [Desulfamplus sp.]
MWYRRDARELALQALFYLDVNKLSRNFTKSWELFDLFCLDFQDMIEGKKLNFDDMTAKELLDFKDIEDRKEEEESEIKDVSHEDQKPFFINIVRGVLENIDEIDALIHENSKNWKISRMAAVDRNIMRIAVYEFIYCPDIPAKVSINEAVEIGKKYGTDDSGAFVNGILDRIREVKNIE